MNKRQDYAYGAVVALTFAALMVAFVAYLRSLA